MANAEHLEILRQGPKVWNEWHSEHGLVRPDLSGADLSNADLAGALLWGVRLTDCDLRGACLNGASLMGGNGKGIDLRSADLREANLGYMELFDANFEEADLRGADLYQANFVNVNFHRCRLEAASLRLARVIDGNLTAAILAGVDLTGSSLINVRLNGAVLTNCSVYGVSAWGLELESVEEQNNLRITPDGEPEITVDNLEIAQFVYLLLNNQKLRNVINSITAKAVLILGRFGPRKQTLDAIRDALRRRGYLPILFDFDIPEDRDVTETIRTLAGLVRFIIADLTDPASIPKELEAIVPGLAVPVRPVIEGEQRPFSMFADYWKYPWVIREPFRYKNQSHLIENLDQHVIDAAEAKGKEVALLRASAR